MISPIRIYLAGTIMSDPKDVNWKESFISSFPSDGYIFLDPNPVKGSQFEVIPRDKKAIESCDFLVAYIQTPTFGTTMEIKHAYDTQRVCNFVINPNEQHMNTIWLTYHVHGMFTNVADCAQSVIETVGKMLIR